MVKVESLSKLVEHEAKVQVNGKRDPRRPPTAPRISKN